MEIQILHLLEGAKQARGLTVIIDVFRAFSLECYLYDLGASAVFPVGSVEQARRMKQQHPDYLLVGERGGKKCEGFDFGNSPSAVSREAVDGRCVIHTTSAGTQGIVGAVHADQILTGSLVNAKAIAAYIAKGGYRRVSLVCMGNGGVRPAKEDELCARYLQSLLTGAPFDIAAGVASLRHDGGEHFFDPANQEVFPREDFWMCTQYDRFPFVLQVVAGEESFVTRRLIP